MAYKVQLEIFEGPLDLLLYLIKKEELDIYDIPITRITAQYLEYLNLMELLDLDIAGDFLVMAATLMHIKSKMLLPPDPTTEEAEELDPRAELVRRLLEYKSIKEAADKLRGFEAGRREFFTRFGVENEYEDGEGLLFDDSLFDLISAFSNILKDLPKDAYHQVMKDEFSVADKVKDIVERLKTQTKIYFRSLFGSAKNKLEVITIFLAVLELVRLKEVQVAQDSPFGEIEIARN